MEDEEHPENWRCESAWRVYFIESLRAVLIARGARMARRMDAELYVVHVDRGIRPEKNQIRTPQCQSALRGKPRRSVVRLKAGALPIVWPNLSLETYHQVIFGRAADHDWRKYLYLSAVHRFLRDRRPWTSYVTQESEEIAWNYGPRVLQTAFQFKFDLSAWSHLEEEVAGFLTPSMKAR